MTEWMDEHPYPGPDEGEEIYHTPIGINPDGMYIYSHKGFTPNTLYVSTPPPYSSTSWPTYTINLNPISITKG